MPTFSSLQIPPSANWQDFETLCCDLWRAIWEDPNTQKNGRQGQLQHGVDIYGRLNQVDLWAGVQCKGKDNFTNKPLTKKEVEAEVEKAKSFKPKLSQFIIATTGPKDAKIEELARKITKEHLKNSLFSVHVWGWNDIVTRLEDYSELVEKYYPGLSLNTQALKEGIDEIKKTTQSILQSNIEVKSLISSPVEKIDTPTIVNYLDISTTILKSEYQAELNHSRDLLNNYKPNEALEFLEKLKSRIWSNAHAIIKYRLLTNIGCAKLNLNQEQEAAKLFLEALQYNPEDEKALCNAALGYMLLGEIKKAKTYANKVLTKNPASSRAYSIIIHISSDDEKLENIITKVPKPYRTAPEVAYAISYLARKRNNLFESKKWLEIAVVNDKENLPELKGDLGGILIELIAEAPSAVYGNQLNEAQKEQIKKSIELLTSVWNRVADTDLRKLRLAWIVNRGLAKRLLGDLEEAIKDVEIALEAEPSNPIFVKHRALLAYEIGDNEKAITLLKGILSVKETPEAPLLLAEALHKENKSLEAISIINKLLRNKPPKPLKEEANRLLIQLYVDTEDFEKARKISDSLRALDPTNILYLVDAAQVSRFSGKSADAIALLNEAKRYITASSSPGQLLELADEFYSLEQFEDAAKIYKKIVDKTLDTPLTHKLLNSYYRAGETGKALNMCQILHNKYGPLKYISEMESAIYEEIGNLPEAKNVCKEYLSLFPKDLGIKLRLAVVNFRSNNFKELDEFLNSFIDIETLPLESALQLAYLHAARNLVQRSFEIMYEIRRKFFNNGDAHLKYIEFFFQRERDCDKWLKLSRVGVDAAVCIKDDSGQREWYIIEDRKDADIHRREITLDHPLAQKLLGKSVEDEILLKENDLSKEFGKIKIMEIKSKYVYALHESLSLFEKLFPNTQGLWKVKIELPEKQGDLPKGFQTILDEVSQQHEAHLKIEQFYKEGKLTVGIFANLIRRNVLDVWEGMISKPDLGLKCCLGNDKEKNYSLSLLDKKPKLTIDIISLMTLHDVNAEDIIIKAFGKLGIAQSTKDLLRDTINERKGIQSEGFMTIGKEGDKFIRQEISAEDVKRSIEYLEKIMNWIKNNCEIIPCRAALDMKRNRKQQLNETIGPSFIDTILIASEPGNLLYSDDERLRSFAKTKYNVDGAWTQIVLMHCLNTNILEKAKYNEIIVKLVCFHYYYTSIDTDVLVEAARQSKWLSSQPYTSVIEILKGKFSDEDSALIVGTNFLYELWKQPILARHRDYLILSLIDVITAERNRRVILDKLISRIKRRFFLLPLAERQIISLIDIWKRMHLV